MGTLLIFVTTAPKAEASSTSEQLIGTRKQSAWNCIRNLFL